MSTIVETPGTAVHLKDPARAAEAPVSSGATFRKIALRSAVTVALLVLLFWQIPLAGVWDAIRNMNGALLAVALLLAIPTQYFQFVRWASLAKEAGEGVSRKDIHRGFWVGYTLGLVTPGRVGQYGRALALHNCSLSRAAGLTILERTYSALVINGFGLIAVVLLPILGWIPPFPLPGIVGEAICLTAGSLLILVGIFPQPMARPLRWIAGKLPLREKTEKAIRVLELVTPQRGSWLLLLASLGLASALLQFVMILSALDSPVPIAAGMLAALLTFFLKGNIPLGIGNLGVGEWTAVVCLAGLGVDSVTAVAASLVLFTMNVFIPGLIGLPFVSTLRVPDWNGLRKARP